MRGLFCSCSGSIRPTATSRRGTRYFHYDDTGLLAEYDASVNLISEYQYKPGSTWMTNPLFKRDATNKVHYYYNSHLGQPLKLFDRSGKITWEGRSQAFGETTVVIEETENNLRFPGQYEDQETGLYYNYHRYFQSLDARYLQRDPIGLLGGLNAYAYVGGQPLSYTDPTGEIAWAVAAAAIATRGGTVFNWHGNWGGPGRVNGKTYDPYTGEGWTEGDDFPREDEEGFVRWEDDEDRAYYEHDVCLNDCEQYKECEPEEYSKCQYECDTQLGEDPAVPGYVGGFFGVYRNTR